MNETVNNTTAPATGSNAAAQAEQPTMADIERAYFSPAELAAPETAETLSKVQAILAAAQVAPVYNFDPQEGVAPGFGLAVYPITERVESRGNVTKGCAIVQIPDPATVAQHEKGAEYINNAILRNLTSKIGSALRSQSASLPTTVEDFLTSRTGEGLATYRELAPHFIKGLKKLGLKTVTVQLLRQIFSSKEFAEDQFPKIPQEKWLFLLDMMIQQATEKKLDPSILNHWKETRDTTEMDIAEDFDTEAFAKLA